MRKSICIALLAGMVLYAVSLQSLSAKNKSGKIVERLQAFKIEYREKLRSGFDMSEVNELFMKFDLAVSENDWVKALKLLDQMEEALDRAKPRMGQTKSPGADSQHWIDDPKMRSRFQLLQGWYRDKKKAGYDLREVNLLLASLRNAGDKKNWEQFGELLEKIESGLSRAAPPAGCDNPALAASWAKARKIENFGFGLEFARPGIASQYSEIGAHWVKMFIYWWKMEPEPPKNGRHSYNWLWLDKLVHEYQTAGFRNITLVIHGVNPWASSHKIRHSHEAGSLPKVQHLRDYDNFVYSLVERYDGDGHDDMNNLQYPVRYFEIESEAVHDSYWKGTVEEYGKLLAIAHKAAKRASPECRIILSGFLFLDLFDDYPCEALVRARFARNARISRAIEFTQKSLKFKDWFDLVEFHYLDDYKGVYGVVDWIRAQMKKNGYEKPIWAGDAVAAPSLHGRFVHPSSADENNETIQILRDDSNPKHRQTVLWYEREQAAGVVKKIIAGMHAGLAGINMGNLLDWPYHIPDQTFEFQGLRRNDSGPRAVFRAYRMLIEKAADTWRIERLRTSANVFAYRLTRDRGPLYVLWCDRGEDQIRLPVEAPKVSVAPTITDAQNPISRPIYKEAKQGAVVLKLTTVPIFVE